MGSVYSAGLSIPINGSFSESGLLQFSTTPMSWRGYLTYPKYSVVSYGGLLWVSTMDSNLGNVPDPGANLLGPWFPIPNALSSEGTLLIAVTEWTDYTYNLYEVVMYQGNAYISTIDGNQGCTPPAACWLQLTGATVIPTPFLDSFYPYMNVITWVPPAYSPTTTYGSGNVVSYNGDTFVSVRFNNIGNAPPDGAMSGIAGLVGSFFMGEWSSTITYVTGQMVSHNSSIWQALTASTNSVPSAGNTNWGSMGASGAFKGSWASGNAYTVGQVVSFQSQYSCDVYGCLTNNSNEEPDKQPTYWANLWQPVQSWIPFGSTVVHGIASTPLWQWDPTVSYSKFSMVVCGGSPWIATVGANITHAPGSDSYWFPLIYSAAALQGGGLSIGTAIPAVGTHFFAQRGSNPPVAITTTGNLGVGTADPSMSGQVGSRLTISTSTDAATGLSIFTGSAKRFALNTQSSGGFLFYDGQGAVWNPGLSQVGGNVGIGTTTPHSKLAVAGLPAYANNAATITGGLAAGDFYRTGGNPDYVCVVH